MVSALGRGANVKKIGLATILMLAPFLPAFFTIEVAARSPHTPPHRARLIRHAHTVNAVVHIPPIALKKRGATKKAKSRRDKPGARMFTKAPPKPKPEKNWLLRLLQGAS